MIPNKFKTGGAWIRAALHLVSMLCCRLSSCDCWRASCRCGRLTSKTVPLIFATHRWVTQMKAPPQQHPSCIVLADAVVQLSTVILASGDGQDPVDDGPPILRSTTARDLPHGLGYKRFPTVCRYHDKTSTEQTVQKIFFDQTLLFEVLCKPTSSILLYLDKSHLPNRFINSCVWLESNFSHFPTGLPLTPNTCIPTPSIL